MCADTVIIPPRLKKGSCIGLFAPSGPVREQQRLDSGISLLREKGFRVKLPRIPETAHSYLAGDDETRLESLHALLNDEEVDAFMAVRGGFGCLRIIDRINFDLMVNRPRQLIGFSDLTVFLNCISHRTGLVTVHGPVATSLCDSTRESTEAFFALLAGQQPHYNERKQIEILRGGTAEGILRGGNLSTLAHLLGTPWDVPLNDCLLFLEDTNEPMYRVDRILTQLFHAGKLAGLGGLILGSFTGENDPVDNLRLQEQIWKRVLELTAGFEYPVWGGFPIGHSNQNYPLPVGGKAIMDSGTAQLHLKSLFT